MKMVDVISGTNRGGARRALGFTLIEVMVVVAIIIILIGAVIAIGAQIRTSSMISTTRGALQNLEQASAQYKLETGIDFAPTSASDIYVKLMAVPSCQKIVLKLNQQLIDDSNKLILDSWGNAIQYKAMGASGAPPLRGYFYSRGPNGVDGDADDILSTDASK